MNFNINSGYGSALAQVLHNRVPVSGKLFVVGDSGTANLDMIKEMFIPDPDGEIRFSATIDGAIGLCTANAGDVILVAPGHSETVSGATSIVADVAGVSIIGMGEGSDRPTITFNTAATASIPVSAANVTFENMIFSADFADIVAVFTVTAKNFTLSNCSIEASAADDNFLSLVETNTTDNSADGLTIKGCSWIEADTATSTAVVVDGDLDSMTFEGNYLNLGVNTNDLPAVAIVATGKDVTNVRILDNQIIRLNDANPLILTADTGADCTGIIAGNKIRHADTAGELLVTTTTSIGFFENYACAVVDKSGFILPAVDS